MPGNSYLYLLVESEEVGCYYYSCCCCCWCPLTFSPPKISTGLKPAFTRPSPPSLLLPLHSISSLLLHHSPSFLSLNPIPVFFFLLIEYPLALSRLRLYFRIPTSPWCAFLLFFLFPPSCWENNPHFAGLFCPVILENIALLTQLRLLLGWFADRRASLWIQGGVLAFRKLRSLSGSPRFSPPHPRAVSICGFDEDRMRGLTWIFFPLL